MMRWPFDDKDQENIRIFTVQGLHSGGKAGNGAQARGGRERRHRQVGSTVSRSLLLSSKIKRTAAVRLKMAGGDKMNRIISNRYLAKWTVRFPLDGRD